MAQDVLHGAGTLINVKMGCFGIFMKDVFFLLLLYLASLFLNLYL